MHTQDGQCLARALWRAKWVMKWHSTCRLRRHATSHEACVSRSPTGVTGGSGGPQHAPALCVGSANAPAMHLSWLGLQLSESERS